MKIKLKTSLCGGVEGKPGDVVECPDDEAARFIAAGYAEPGPGEKIPTIAASAESKPEKRKPGRPAKSKVPAVVPAEPVESGADKAAPSHAEADAEAVGGFDANDQGEEEGDGV